MMNHTPKFCVIGAGNGGLAMAGHLAIMDENVTLWNRSEENIKGIIEYGGIDVSGVVSGFAEPNLVTNDMEKAVSGSDVIMIAIPATGHADMAKRLATYLRPGQIVILNPGRTGGALEFRNILNEMEVQDGMIVAETQTFLYTCRRTGSHEVLIKKIKNCVPLAALPAYQTPYVLRAIKSTFSQFIPADSVLSTSFDNIGAIFHPAILLLNASRIECNQPFDYYTEGITPCLSHLIKAIDMERIAVASALGVRTHTAREWLYLAYNAEGETLYDALQANDSYKGISSPDKVNHRYITEDVPTSLVPIALIGEMLGVPTPTIRSIIQMASVIHDIDYMNEGRTLEKLGIKGLSVREIRILALEGRRSLSYPDIVSYRESKQPMRDSKIANINANNILTDNDNIFKQPNEIL